MRADELCERTAERLAELRIGVIMPADQRNVLLVGTPVPCLVVCRVRLNREARRLTGLPLPVLLVRTEGDIERLALILGYASADGQIDLDSTALAMRRVA